VIAHAMAYTTDDTYEWKLVRRSRAYVTLEEAIESLYHAIQEDSYNLTGEIIGNYAHIVLVKLTQGRSSTGWNGVRWTTLDLVWGEVRAHEKSD
jgi:hypothetical protein